MRQILHWTVLGTILLFCGACASPQYRDTTGMPIQPLGVPLTPSASVPTEDPNSRKPLPLKIGLDLQDIRAFELHRGGSFYGRRRGQEINIKIGASSAQLLREGFARNFEVVEEIEKSPANDDFDLLATPRITCLDGRTRGHDVFDAAIQYQVTLTDRNGNTNLVTSRMATATYDRPFTWKDWLLLPVYILGYGFGIDSTGIDSYMQAFAQAESAAYQDLESTLRSHLEERRVAAGAYSRLTPIDEDPSAKIKVMIERIMAQIPSAPIRRIAIGGVIRSQGEKTTLEDHIEIGLWKNLSKIAPHERLTLYEQRETLNQMQVKSSDLVRPEIAQQLALYTRADTIFAGTTTGGGESVTVAVKVIDIKTGTTIAVGDVAIRQGRPIPDCPQDLKW